MKHTIQDAKLTVKDLPKVKTDVTKLPDFYFVDFFQRNGFIFLRVRMQNEKGEPYGDPLYVGGICNPDTLHASLGQVIIEAKSGKV